MSTQVDFSVTPAKAKCDKCNKEEEIPAGKSLSILIKFLEEFKNRHKDCV